MVDPAQQQQTDGQDHRDDGGVAHRHRRAGHDADVDPGGREPGSGQRPQAETHHHQAAEHGQLTVERPGHHGRRDQQIAQADDRHHDESAGALPGRVVVGDEVDRGKHQKDQPDDGTRRPAAADFPDRSALGEQSPAAASRRSVLATQVSCRSPRHSPSSPATATGSTWQSDLASAAAVGHGADQPEPDGPGRQHQNPDERDGLLRPVPTGRSRRPSTTATPWPRRAGTATAAPPGTTARRGSTSPCRRARSAAAPRRRPTTDPMTRPATANGIRASQIPRPAPSQVCNGMCTCPTSRPARNTSTMAGSATSSDTTDLLTMYARGESADSRSWRFQPVCRSMAIRAPELMAAPRPP